MNVQKAKIIGGVVVNIIEVDPKAVPDWCAGWPTTTPETAIGGVYQGGVFFPPAEYIPTRAEQETNRRVAYTREADPMAMQMLRGDALKDEWLAKIAEIKLRYPYPAE